jgi:hypothetical protein
MNYKLPTTIVADVILLTSFDTIFTDISTVALRAFHGNYSRFHTLIMQRQIKSLGRSRLRLLQRRLQLDDASVLETKDRVLEPIRLRVVLLCKGCRIILVFPALKCCAL